MAFRALRETLRALIINEVVDVVGGFAGAMSGEEEKIFIDRHP
jgi:hypothetical protein